MYSPLSKAITQKIKDGAEVLTANTRLARGLRSLYDREMRGNAAAWGSPVIMPFFTWMERLWARVAPEEALLGHARSRALWERVVASDARFAGTGRPGAPLVNAGREAYSLMKQHMLKLPDDEIYLTEEVKAFKGWVKEYESVVEKLGLTDALSLPEKLPAMLKRSKVALPRAMVLAGFDEITPAMGRLIDSLRQKGVETSVFPEAPPGPGEDAPPVFPEGGARVREYKDMQEEVVQAARWARQIVSRPGTRVGFVVADLERYRPVIKREFAAELSPASVLRGGAGAAFDISQGEPLCDAPLVRSALDLLSMDLSIQDIDALFGALKSPYFSGSAKDFMVLSVIEDRLKRENRMRCGLKHLWRRVSTMTGMTGMTGAPGSPARALASRLDGWIKALKELSNREPPSRWAGLLSRLLKEAGWLFEVRLDDTEREALDAWKGLLEEFAGLDDVMGRVTRAEVAATLARMAREKPCRNDALECAVEVMGLAEAAGLGFDCLWLMGCHSDALPPRPEPNPFIPLYIQKRHALPRSSAERELASAKGALRGLIKGPLSIEVSYPKAMDDREARLSPLFSGWGLQPSSERYAGAGFKDLVHGRYAVEDAPAPQPVPVTAAERETLSGGTAIIKDQSLCPFRAFAIHRLNARTTPEPEPGLTPAQRGRLLHAAMRIFCEEAGDSKALKGLIASGALAARIRALAERVVSEAGIAPDVSRRVIDIEKDRIASLLEDWAGLEAKRSPFIVRKVEAECSISIEGLPVACRIDRVDDLEDGGAVVMDYKSGDSELKADDWLCARPRDPQMIIYALTGRFTAVSFARLVPGECRFIGISGAKGVLPGVSTIEDGRWKTAPVAAAGDAWDALRGFWQETVNALAREFLAGVADVDPNGGPVGRNSPCRRCELGSLCRISEAGYAHDD